MKNTLFKKCLVIGMSLLFIGLAFISSLNAVSINKDIKEVNSAIDDIEKDCYECQSNGKTQLAEKLLNRLEKNEVLSKVININNPDDERPICKILISIFESIAIKFYSINALILSYQDYPTIQKMLAVVALQLLTLLYSIGIIIVALGCVDFPPYPY